MFQTTNQIYIYRCDVDENGISKDGTLGGTLGLELCNGVVLLLIPRHSRLCLKMRID